MAAVMAVGLLGSMTACSAAKPVIPDRQVKMSEDYIFEILDGEWITDDECGKIVFDCGGDIQGMTCHLFSIFLHPRFSISHFGV